MTAPIAAVSSLVAAALAIAACSSSNDDNGGAGAAASSATVTSSASGATSSGGASTASSSSSASGAGGAGSCALTTILDGFAPARTLYVSPSGDDAADGLSTATAWKTIAHAAAYQPGDEIEVAAGTYSGVDLEKVAGTAAAPIRFVSSGGAGAAIFDGGALLVSLHYVAFEGFEFRNSPSGHCINLNSGAAPYQDLSDHVLFKSIHVHDCGLSAIKTSQAFAIDVFGSELASNTQSGNPLIDFVAVHDSRIVGNDIHDGVSEGVQVKGGAYNCLVESNRIHDVGAAAVNLGEATGTDFYLPMYTDWEASRSVAANNLIYGSVHAAVSVQGCDHCVVAHNTMWATMPAFFVRGLSTTNQSGASISDVGTRVVDNIFAADVVPIPLNIVPPNDAMLDQSNNLYFSTQGMIAGAYSDTPIGGSGNLLDVDPKLVDASLPDLHLAPGSPAIGAGVAVPEVPRTFDGACRTDDDLGAY